MASTESIDRLLRIASTLLDRAAGEMRDAQLQPVRPNILQIGKALAEIFEIQSAIWETHPNLRPAYMNETSPHPEANRQLTVAMSQAVEHEDSGNFAHAISIYREFLTHESTPHLQAIAQAEIERLLRKSDD